MGSQPHTPNISFADAARVALCHDFLEIVFVLAQLSQSNSGDKPPAMLTFVCKDLRQMCRAIVHVNNYEL